MRLPWPRNHPRGSFSPVFQGESCRQGSVPCVRRAGVVDLFARKRAPTSARRSPLAGDCFSPIFQEESCRQGSVPYIRRAASSTYSPASGLLRRLVGARLRATRRLHDKNRPRENRPNARAGLLGCLSPRPRSRR